MEESRVSVSQTLRWMSHGPKAHVLSYSGYIINGFRFFTKDRDDTSSVQNSGVAVMAETMQVCSSKDKKPIVSDMTFFGTIQQIWELDYVVSKVVVFKCKWVDSSRGVKVDDGFTVVDLSKTSHKSDPFILADQVKQVFYVEDGMDTSWSIVVPNLKNDFASPIPEDDVDYEAPATELFSDAESSDSTDDETCLQIDEEGTWIDND